MIAAALLPIAPPVAAVRLTMPPDVRRTLDPRASFVVKIAELAPA